MQRQEGKIKTRREDKDRKVNAKTGRKKLRREKLI